MVGGEGIGPSTSSLSEMRSTTELAAHLINLLYQKKTIWARYKKKARGVRHHTPERLKKKSRHKFVQHPHGSYLASDGCQKVQEHSTCH